MPLIDHVEREGCFLCALLCGLAIWCPFHMGCVFWCTIFSCRAIYIQLLLPMREREREGE